MQELRPLRSDDIFTYETLALALHHRIKAFEDKGIVSSISPYEQELYLRIVYAWLAEQQPQKNLYAAESVATFFGKAPTTNPPEESVSTATTKTSDSTEN